MDPTRPASILETTSASTPTQSWVLARLVLSEDTNTLTNTRNNNAVTSRADGVASITLISGESAIPPLKVRPRNPKDPINIATVSGLINDTDSWPDPGPAALSI